MAVTFVPHLVPLDRGILETIYARLQPGVDAAAIESGPDDAYGTSPFVRLTGSDLPEIKHVAHTNFCDIGWRVDRPGGQLVMVSCIDNLVKGAAGQAIQNFNVAYGFDETAGAELTMATVLKLGGELLEDAAAMRIGGGSDRRARGRRAAGRRPRRRARDRRRAAAARQSPKFVDGLRITDAAALDTVVAVLAGRTNTAFVARARRRRRPGGRPDRGGRRIGLSRRAAPLTTVAGELVDLGLVGEPVGTDAALLR